MSVARDRRVLGEVDRRWEDGRRPLRACSPIWGGDGPDELETLGVSPSPHRTFRWSSSSAADTSDLEQSRDLAGCQERRGGLDSGVSDVHTLSEKADEAGGEARPASGVRVLGGGHGRL